MIRFLKTKFSTKVVLAIFLVILIPTTFISAFFFVSSSNIIKENVRESSLQIARQAADSLSFMLTVGNDTSDFLYSNESLQQMVKQDNEISEPMNEKVSNNEAITSLLNSQVYSNSFVRMIYILKIKGTSWGSGTFSPIKLSKYSLPKLDWIRDADHNDGAIAWQGLQYDLFSGAGENSQLVLPATRVMKDFNRNLENIAYIQVCIDGQEVLNRINQLKLGKTGHFFVVNQHGEIMIDTNLENINKTVKNHNLYDQIVNDKSSEFEFRNKTKNYYAVKAPLTNGWTIVGTVPIEEITGELTKVQQITIFTSLLFTIVAVIISLFAANRVTRPIKILTQQMKLVGKGDFKVRTKINSEDEIGLMSQQFNQMINQVEQLMDQVKEEQIQKSEAELRAIKHRINPHFLFNTLSTIRWLVKFKQTEKANSALSALIRLLEANMGKKGTFITVKEELDIVEKFLAILQIRYEQTFRIELDIDPVTEDFPIPMMLIQPIVENAVFHGIVPRGTGGTISIKGNCLDEGVKITITDNGVGIDKNVLNNLVQISSQKNSFIGIGLKHVYDSIRLYYSESSSVTIECGQNGTMVTLVLIPKDSRSGNHV